MMGWCANVLMCWFDDLVVWWFGDGCFLLIRRILLLSWKLKVECWKLGKQSVCWFGDLVIWWWVFLVNKNDSASELNVECRMLKVGKVVSLVVWWFGSLVVWWFGDLVIWWFGDWVIWWCISLVVDNLAVFRHGG